MLTLPPEEVHIWRAHLPSLLRPELEATLSLSERARAARFHFAEHRLAYQFAHAFLRDVLASYMECAPRDLQFGQNAFGKPFLHEGVAGKPPEFNLSHAGSLVLLGVCRGRRIGIDVEEIRPMKEISSIAESYFTPRECAFILQQQPAHQDEAFFRCWTRKEACIKAAGKGMSIPLNSFDTLIAQEPEGGPVEIASDSMDGVPWQLTELAVPAGYRAAVAVESGSGLGIVSGIGRLVYKEWQASAAGEAER